MAIHRSSSVTEEHLSHGAITEPAASGALAGGYSVSGFIELLFHTFEEARIDYCVLHGWDGLPEALSSDLDLAVHPKDHDKLPSVFCRLREFGFLPIDCHNYEVNAQTFYFCWFHDAERHCIAIDVIFEYRGNGTIILTANELMTGRRRHRSFWIPEPAVALRYLLAKRTMKRRFAPPQQQHIKRLLFELGKKQSEAAAAALFGEQMKRRVVETALADGLDEICGELATAMSRTALRTNPLATLRCLVGEGLRLLRRIVRPTGILIAVMGPDGVGKSTLIREMMGLEWPEFQSRCVFHWRPQFIGKRPDLGPLTDPHGIPARGTFGSVLRLAGFFADYWLGHIFVIRPRLVRSGLVIFDRYFDDIAIDSKRYRYGGPSWLPRVLVRLAPRPDMFVVLDADVERVLSRKQEIREEELLRLREDYAELASCGSNCVVISTDTCVVAMLLASLRALADQMNRRFERRLNHWVAPPHESL